MTSSQRPLNLQPRRLTTSELHHIITLNRIAPVNLQNPAIDELADEIALLWQERATKRRETWLWPCRLRDWIESRRMER